MAVNPDLPDLLQREWLRQRDRFNAAAGDELVAWLDGHCRSAPDFAEQLRLVWSCSSYVAEYACHNPPGFQELVTSGDLNRTCSQGYCPGPGANNTGVENEEALGAYLRRIRNRELVRIIWRDFARLSDLSETLRDMTSLAQACLDTALEFLHARACERYGVPTGGASGRPQKMVVLGMGKLGASELNVSSDIDLIFAYPESGETIGTARPCTNQEFFERLGRKLIQVLDSRTVDGIVFRVDMRLRPHGGSAPLVASFDALENYYQTQGRGWERFAMIKARPVAGDLDAGAALLRILRPFTYRKYIDFSSIESLREIKAVIEHEVHRDDTADDVKRGSGGIREVEFIAQAFQLVRGGRDPRLQRRSLLDILPLLEQEGLLPTGKAAALIDAYRFLRNVEHAVQGFSDSQTQRLPRGDLGRARLGLLFGCSDWQEFRQQLQQRRAVVQQVFSAVIAAPESAASEQSGVLQAGQQLWQLVQHGKPITDDLMQLGFDDPESSKQQLQSLLSSKPVQLMQATARERLDVLMPMLLAGCAAQQQPSQVLKRTLQLVESVVRRSAYMLLLVENPGALQQLVKLCAASSWIAEHIATWPALLDELLDPRTLYGPIDKATLADELRQQLLRVPEDDLEQQMDVLRYFKHSSSLRVAACEVTEALPLMKVSDSLTWIAEVLLAQVLELAWRQHTERHGEPGPRVGETGVGGMPCSGFSIVGYGKLGGAELGHSSDLDLVFIYDADPSASTSGERVIDNATFFLRLGQRVIHLLTTRTAAGVLYDVDMRLRPSGKSGMLVSSLAAFDKYQSENAWTWEHQALVRARPVAGDPRLAQKVEKVRQQVLRRPRQLDVLKSEVRDMRRKMSEHLTSAGPEHTGVFDLKQDSGGIVDIEFMVQFAVLAWAAEHPQLARWSDNIRILETLSATGKMATADVEHLIEAYKAYRSAGHRAQLQRQPAVVPASEFRQQRAQVTALWDTILEGR